MEALIKAPDCFTMVVALLDPHELQRVRCVSKGIYRGTTKEMMIQCIKITMARYSGPHAMPDGAVRFYSPFGKSTFDICKTEGVQSGYQLKQEGFHVQDLERINFANKLEITMDHLLRDRSLHMTLISKAVLERHEITMIWFNATVKDKKVEIASANCQFEIPADSPDLPNREIEGISFRDFDFYKYRVNGMKPTLLPQLFEARDKISALESEKTALQTRLADVERMIADAKRKLL